MAFARSSTPTKYDAGTESKQIVSYLFSRPVILNPMRKLGVGIRNPQALERADCHASLRTGSQ